MRRCGVARAAIALGTVLACATCLAALHRWIFVLGYLLRVHGRRPEPERAASACARFATVIPAHNEELLIAAAIDSIYQSDYPRAALKVYVLADNCSDRTAEIARRHGAFVLERFDTRNRGKGFALAHAIDALDFADSEAIAIMDADVLVGPGFYAAMNRELQRGALVLQGYDGMSNPDDSMLTCLIAVTSVMKNLLYNAGKAALGFSPLFQGKGMVFDVALLKQRGWRARGLSEDQEEALMVIAEGYRIGFVSDARLYAQEAASLEQARPQRDRWAGGRRQLRSSARTAFATALRTRDWVLGEAALGLLMPTYSRLITASVVALALLGLGRSGDPSSPVWPLGWVGVALVLQLMEFGLGLWLIGARSRYVCSVVFAPVFLVWKAMVELRLTFGSRRGAWVRTGRQRRGSDRPWAA